MAGFRKRCPVGQTARLVCSGRPGSKRYGDFVDLEGLDPHRMPVHVACVMDGNGRWAQKRGLPRTEGHRAGEEALFDAIQGAVELGVQWLTVYAFSTENWRRPADEVRFLLNVIADNLLLRRRDDLNRMGVRIRFIGRRDW